MSEINGQPGATPGEGEQPAGGGEQQQQASQESQQQQSQTPGSNPPGNGTQASENDSQQTPQNNEPERLTQEEWQRRRDDEEAANSETRERREAAEKRAATWKSAPVLIRDRLDELQEKLDLPIPRELRQPLYDLLQEVLEGGESAAMQNMAADLEQDSKTLEAFTLSVYGAMPQADRKVFSDAVKSKAPGEWIPTLLRQLTPGIQGKYLSDEVTPTLRNLLPETGTFRADFDKAIEGKSKPQDILQAFHDQLVVHVGPGKEPAAVAKRGSGTYDNLEQLNAARTSGQLTDPMEYLEHQNRLLKVSN